jgi:hypothetical protein
MGVGVDILKGDPRVCVSEFDPEFFAQLTGERCASWFAAFHLPTRKLPEARVGLARGALREQKPIIGTEDHRGGDLYQVFSR